MPSDLNSVTQQIAFAPGQIIKFKYKNWQGVVANRAARIECLIYSSSEWHPEPQWLVKAFDFDRRETRLFALVDMVPLTEHD
jgi:hypothetical protein